MISNFVYVLITFMLMFALTYGEDFKSYEIEEGCRKVGGICMPSDECPVKIKPEYRSLCPKANKDNPLVECCHGISLKETRCKSLGGVCRPKCRKKLTESRAKDCPVHTVCCVLV